MKYKELMNEMTGELDPASDNLNRAIQDAIRNLNRKIGAHIDGMIELKRLISEFEFERDALTTELELSQDTNARVKRFANRLLASIGDFIEKSGYGKKRSTFDNTQPRSKTVAYVLWIIGGFGTLGFHRFYLGKTGTGIAWFFTGGLLFMGALYDLFALGGMVKQHNTTIQLEERKVQRLRGREQTT